MVYYLGNDVKVYLTTETPEAQVDVASNAISAISHGGSSAAATAALACVDGDLNTENQFTEGEYVKLTSADETTRVYVLCDGSESGAPATGTVLSSGDDTGASTLSSGTAALGTCVAVLNNLNTHNQGTVLNEFRAAILHANGHAGKLTCSAAVTPADGAQTITITQVVTGTAGNKTTAVTTNPQITCANFTGGVSDANYNADSTFAEGLDNNPVLTAISDLTGVDLSIGVTDEDITYIGAKTVLKAEIKKETSITLTRKKSNNVWDVIYNGPTAADEGWSGSAAETGSYGARWGVIEGTDGDWYINNGLMAPKDVVDYGTTTPCFGYRVHIELKNGTEVFSIPACQLVGHTVTLNADGTTEETCELMSHVTPIIGTSINTGRLSLSDL